MTTRELRDLAEKLLDLSGPGYAASVYIVGAEICERLEKLIQLVEDVPEPILEEPS